MIRASVHDKPAAPPAVVSLLTPKKFDEKSTDMARTKRAARIAIGMRAPRPYKEPGDGKSTSSNRTSEAVDGQLVLYNKMMSPQSHSRAFVQVTHFEAAERFWVQVVKHKDGVVWGIVDNSLISADWPQGKKIRFADVRVFDIFAGEA